MRLVGPANDTTGQYTCCHPLSSHNVGAVGVAEHVTLAELIADCAQLPDSVLQPAAPMPTPRVAPPWRVSEECLDRVAGMDDYGA